jgi:hypothetical protein
MNSVLRKQPNTDQQIQDSRITMPALPSELRRQLENVCVAARDIAEAAARSALQKRAVDAAEPFAHFTAADRELRTRLRARGRQAGDVRDDKKKTQTIDQLTGELAYEYWHRMLFARFLAENHLLMHPDGVAVSLAECEELARSEGAPNGFVLAARYASRMLPQVFRTDDVLLEIEFAPEQRLALEKLLASLPRDTFLADDSLGWVYQFWQTKRKEQVNKSGDKIDGRTLPAVTQLFTEDYMVQFLLHNTIGAWWAGKRMKDEGGRMKAQWLACQTEADCRRLVALPGVAWEYLRWSVDTQLSVVSRVDSRQSSVDSRQSSVDSRQSSVDSCQSSVDRSEELSHEPQTTNHKPQTTNHEQRTTNHEPQTTNHEQRTTNHEQLTTDNGPLTNWRPASGTFDGWPQTLGEFTMLDPCCGSGHFLVNAFNLLVPLRMHDEGLSAAEACDAVLRDNLFGLELDPRCTQIAAFALALAAWRYPGEDGLPLGHRELPPLNIAACGLAPNASLDEWLRVAERAAAAGGLPVRRDLLGAEQNLLSSRIRGGLEELYRLFEQGPTLGSLLDPATVGGDLLAANFEQLQPLLAAALESETPDAEARELGVAAHGFAKAARLLAGKYTLVATNVPYLGRGKQSDELKQYCEQQYPDAKADLATCFVERCLAFCARSRSCQTSDGAKPPPRSGDFGYTGSVALVTPQNWLFLGTYKKLRKRLLEDVSWNVVARLGPRAFETISGEVVNVALLSLTSQPPADQHALVGLEASEEKTAADKAGALCKRTVVTLEQMAQLENPDARIVLAEQENSPKLSEYADSFLGLGTGDFQHYGRCFWELFAVTVDWTFHQCSVYETQLFGGREYVLAWDNSIARVRGMLPAEREQIHNQDQSGQQAWGRCGVAVALMRELKATLYTGEKYEKALTVLVPKQEEYLPAIWVFCDSERLNSEVRKLDQKIIVANATVAKVPFDLAHWQAVAAEKYPDGLPKPYSSDPTQWLFDGFPAGSDDPLQVGVARLLGYRWPRQTGSSFPDCPALGPDGLESLADADGLVPIPSVRGEPPAAERLQELLSVSCQSSVASCQLPETGVPTNTNGPRTTDNIHNLLTAAGCKPGTSVDDWLRNGFFEQHCKRFHNRPFIWHIWDGRKDGFACLVNYHALDHARLESLTYSYLGDWLRAQADDARAGKPGADLRLAAAQALQEKLKLILAGEPPYDIFVRWKPLREQAIGWNPDLNDGVRMNIRPFVVAGVLRKNPNIKWTKDRGREPQRDPDEYPWFWDGNNFIGDRLNDIHLTTAEKQAARNGKSQG